MGEYTLFSMVENKHTVEPISSSKSGGSTSVTRGDDGSWKFELEGSMGLGATWFVPVGVETSSQCKVHFNISSKNTGRFQGKPNVYLVLKTLPAVFHQSRLRQGEDGVETEFIHVKEIPIFTASGSKDTNLGWLPVNRSGKPVLIAGFYFDIGLLDCCKGDVTVYALSITSDKNLLSPGEVETILSSPPPVKASIHTQGDQGLRVSINGEANSLLAYSPGNNTNNSSYGTFFSEYGVNITRTIVNFGGENTVFKNQEPVWKHPDYIDFWYIDKLITQALPNKRSYVIIDVLLNTPPDWWKRKQASVPPLIPPSARINSDQAARVTTERPQAIKAIDDSEDSDRYPISDLNRSWKNYCKAALTQLLAYIRTRSYSRNVIGCNVICGKDMNNFPYTNRDRHPDYSLSFQEWLLEKYRDVSRLQKSWKNSDVDFRTAKPVSQNSWHSGNIFSLVHPLSEKNAIDSHLFYHLSWNRSLLEQCKLVKNLSHGYYLSGVVGGAGLIFNSLWNSRYLPTSETVYSILHSEFVDYVEIPVDPVDLRAGSGSNGAEFVLSDELRKNDKCLWLRNDVPFSVSYFKRKNVADDFDDVIQIHRRIFAASLANNAPMYFFQKMSLDYRQSFVKKEIKTFQAISEKKFRLDKRKRSEIAFVVDFDVFKYLAPESGRELRHLRSPDMPYDGAPAKGDRTTQASHYFHTLGIPRLVWNRLGAPYDVVDINMLKPDPYKIIVFFHTLFLDETREQIVNSCKNNGRYIVSLWANGFVTERYLTGLGAEKLNGMAMRVLPRRARFGLTPRPELETFINRRFGKKTIGWIYPLSNPADSFNKRLGPIFQVTDKKATILADYVDGYAAGMAIKNFPDWTSFYSGSPIVNPEIMRELMRKSGAHTYLDTNDLVYINDSFIGIHTLDDGVRQLKLPQAQALYEVFREQALDKNKIHDIKLQGRKTYLFFRGDKKTWDSL